MIFQYQNFLKMYNLDYEFNSLTRLDKTALIKHNVDFKHEAKEKAAREFYLENEKKRYTQEIREKYYKTEEGSQQRVEKFRREMDDVADDMEGEWKKLFSSITEFKTRINV